jgi:hypothetical protein
MKALEKISMKDALKESVARISVCGSFLECRVAWRPATEWE